MDLISLLIGLVILCAVCYVVWLVLNLLPVPQPFKQIILAVFGLIVLIIVLTNLGGMLGSGSGHWLSWGGPHVAR
jgi:hypothetical protein